MNFYITHETDPADLIGKFKMVKILEGDLTTTLKIVHILAPVALAFRDGGDVTFRGFANASPDVAALVKTMLTGVRTLVTPDVVLKRHADFVPVLHPNKGFTTS